jgi:chromosome segregation ATPase
MLNQVQESLETMRSGFVEKFNEEVQKVSKQLSEE